MDKPESDIRTQEEQNLTRVIAAIDAEITARGGNTEQALKDLREIDSTDYNARNRMLAQSNTGATRIRRLAEQRLSPYFGRVDFDDLKDKVHERIYLGPSHIRHKGVDYVHDWRAPVGELFYQTYGGHTTYRAPSGVIPVDIHLKRRLTIKDSALVDVADTFDGSDPDPSIADSLLADMLKRSAGTNMGQIVRSIQAEQDAVIRTSGDIVIVQGPAGSGKTVVALHRAAYLLYQMRQSADPKQYALATASSMRVFSPNRVFAEYISHVLPDLQEDAIEQSVFEQFLLNELITRLRADKALKCTVLRKEEHFERMLEAQGDDYARLVNACREKTAASMAGELREFLQAEESALRGAVVETATAAVQNGKPVLPTPDLLSRFDGAGQENDSLLERLQAVIAYVKDEIAERQTQLRRAKRPASRNTNDVFRLSAKQQDALAAQIESLTALAKGLARLEQGLNKKPLLALYTEFWRQRESAGPAAEAVRAETLAALANGGIAYEDIPPMLCLNGYYRGFPKLKGTIHAIVDECQDYTPLHYEFLKQCLPAGCMMTVVGDLNQTVDETVSLGSYDSLAAVFPGRTKRLDLTRSYRSSLEITAFASAILGSGAHIDNVRRSGRLPEIIAVPGDDALPAAVARAVDRMRGSDYLQIAVVCKSRREAQEAFDTFPAEIGASLLTEDADHIAQGVVVVPIAQAKGLEFDAVIVHDAGERVFSRPADRRLLYTACTRALHDLVLLYTGEISPIVPTDEALSERTQFEDMPTPAKK